MRSGTIMLFDNVQCAIISLEMQSSKIVENELVSLNFFH